MKRHLISATLLALTVAIFGSACAGSGDREILAEFANVGDLVGRANVQQADAVIGTVRSIDLVQREDEWVARVTMSVNEDAQITSQTRATVRSTSLLGEKFVDLETPSGSGPQLRSGAVLRSSSTAKAPELEDLLAQLGGILATGAVEDLARITSAGAMILEGQEDNVGRVLDQTAKLMSSLHAQRDAIASAVDDLSSSAETLAGGIDIVDKALGVSDDALRIVADQKSELDALVVQLDRLGAPLGNLTRAHKEDIDAQVKALRKAVPELFSVRETLGDAVEKLPDFTRLFADAAPGDYIQLDILLQAVPVDLGAVSLGSAGVSGVFMEATR
jgi:phospholipid/cholesterol/gamma-HCH transport system substrate-binding protein